MTIGEKIREARLKKGLTQSDLAELLGYKSRSSINKIEVEGRDIPRSSIVKFAEVLGVSPSYLMGWEEEQTAVDTKQGTDSKDQLNDVYFSFAKNAQDEGIDPDDIMLAIETIRNMRRKKDK